MEEQYEQISRLDGAKLALRQRSRVRSSMAAARRLAVSAAALHQIAFVARRSSMYCMALVREVDRNNGHVIMD